MIHVFSDTSYYLALLNPRDSLHSKACAVTERLNGILLTTEWVITELANSLSQIVNRQLFLDFYLQLRSDPGVRIVPFASTLWEEGIRLYADRLDKEWSLTDCISFVVMSQYQITSALTSDHHFEQAGFQRLLST